MPGSSSSPEKSEARLFFVIHGVITLIFSLIMCGVIETEDWLSLVYGQLFVWLSLLSLSLSLFLIFSKKNIALFMGVIVLKWPILIYIVYVLARRVHLSGGHFALGFSPLLFSGIIWAVIKKQ